MLFPLYSTREAAAGGEGGFIHVPPLRLPSGPSPRRPPGPLCGVTVPPGAEEEDGGKKNGGEKGKGGGGHGGSQPNEGGAAPGPPLPASPRPSWAAPSAAPCPSRGFAGAQGVPKPLVLAPFPTLHNFSRTKT